MSKHTPGPWDRSIWGLTPVFRGAHEGCYIQKGNDELIAFVTAREVDVGEANARLIAAAPKMLEALRLADRALQIHTFQPRGPAEKDRDTCARCGGNVRSEYHTRVEDGHASDVVREAIIEVQSTLAEATGEQDQ